MALARPLEALRAPASQRQTLIREVPSFSAKEVIADLSRAMARNRIVLAPTIKPNGAYMALSLCIRFGYTLAIQ